MTLSDVGTIIGVYLFVATAIAVLLSCSMRCAPGQAVEPPPLSAIKHERARSAVAG
jgi:hypothetical protein